MEPVIILDVSSKHPDVDLESLEDILPYDETLPDEPEMLAHIVSPPENPHIFQPGMEAQDIVDTARMLGLEVVALCGKRWVPKRNPDKYDACGTCIEIAGNILGGLGE